MAQSNNGSNSDGPVTTKEHMEEILNTMTGLSLIMHYPSGHLFIDISNPNENYGCWLEILSSTLQSSKAGSISVRVVLD